MKISRTKAALAGLLLAGVASAGLFPALGQETPESLLPPGFDDPPAPAPAPRPAPAPAPAPGPSATAAAPDAGVGDMPAEERGEAAEAQPSVEDLTKGEVPEDAKRTLDRIGAYAWGNEPYPANAFGRADGRFVATLMRRMGAPIASRWTSIALRRALLSPTNTPRNINGADYAAERAWLLIRMGEPVAARMVIQDVDVENFTPRLFEVGMQSALASADPAGMCPLVEPAATVVDSRGWRLARAFCAGLGGQPQRGGQLLDQARRQSGNDFDTLLAEKILGIGSQARAVTLEWDGVTQLSSWRWGLAMASGETVPDRLYGTVGPQVRYWQALSPRPDPRDRTFNAELAAAQGVFSSAGLIDLFAEVEAQGDGNGADVAVARDLRTAYTAADQAARMTALRTIWTANDPRIAYARLVLTAHAAAAIRPDAAFVSDADMIVSSLLSAGMEGQALRWQPVVKRGGDGAMMLALANPSGSVSSGDFDAYRSFAGPRKAQMALAGLAGLGKLDADTAQRAADSLRVDLSGANAWTRAIDMAGRRGDPGSVTLLAAVGMQTRSWSRVTPEALYHLIRAMRAAGLGQYARMIAVEAIARSA